MSVSIGKSDVDRMTYVFAHKYASDIVSSTSRISSSTSSSSNPCNCSAHHSALRRIPRILKRLIEARRSPRIISCDLIVGNRTKMQNENSNNIKFIIKKGNRFAMMTKFSTDLRLNFQPICVEVENTVKNIFPTNSSKPSFYFGGGRFEFLNKDKDNNTITPTTHYFPSPTPTNKLRLIKDSNTPNTLKSTA